MKNHCKISILHLFAPLLVVGLYRFCFFSFFSLQLLLLLKLSQIAFLQESSYPSYTQLRLDNPLEIQASPL